MRTKAILLGALCLLLAGGLILSGAGAAAQTSEPTPILIQVSPYQGADSRLMLAVSVEDGTVLWFLNPINIVPFSPYRAMVNADRASLVLETRDDWGADLFQVELPGSSYRVFREIASLFTGILAEDRPTTIEYALTPNQDTIVAVAGRDLIISPIGMGVGPGESMPNFPLEIWILSDQEIRDAEVVMDPLARHAYVRINLTSGAYGYDDYLALWVDLANLAAEPVKTDIVWASWSDDGAYLTTFSPDEGLVIRDSGTLEALPWSADLPVPLEAHGFVWGTDGQTAYYRTGDVHQPGLIRLDLVAEETHLLGTSRLLTERIPSSERPIMHLGGGGNAALFELRFYMEPDRASLINLTSGEQSYGWSSWEHQQIATSPTQDFFLIFNGWGGESSCEFHAWREGIELAGRWDGPVALYGWTLEGLPILQTLSFEDVPEDYSRYPSDRTTPVPDPGWYVFDIAEDGAAIWTALSCPDCRVIPAGFPAVQLSVQRPDGAPVFAVVGTGDAGAGVYVVDLVAGTAKLVFEQEPERVTQIDWLAPGSLPLESAPYPTEDPHGPHG